MGNFGDERKVFTADPERLEQYERARTILASAQAPVLYDNTDPRHRVFHALFDGTSNNADTQPDKITNIGKLRNQLDELPDAARDGGRVAHAYLPGPGTQKVTGPLSAANQLHDLATGASFDDRVNRMYAQLVEQVREWKREYEAPGTWHDPTNPDTDLKVSLVTSGFSRGAVQAMGLQRKVSEEGIVDADGTVLIPPGKVAIAAVALDPVATGRPENRDLRPAHDLVSMLHIGATDERRRMFPVTELAQEGVSPDGSLIGIKLPGAHGDVGGGPKEAGLSNRAGNMAIAYLNALHRQPLFEPMAESLQQDINVVHRPDAEAKWRFTEIFKGPAPRDTPDGVRQEMAPSSFRPPTGIAPEGASEGKLLHTALDDTRETRRLPQSANAVLGHEYVWRAVEVPVQPTHPGHPDHARLMGISMMMDSAFNALDGVPRPTPDDFDRLAANLAHNSKAAGLTDLTAVRIENTQQGLMVFAVQGNADDLSDARNRYAGVPLSGDGLMPTMDAFKAMEQTQEPQPRLQQQPPQALEANQATDAVRRDPM